jgi:hypothetical protein
MLDVLSAVWFAACLFAGMLFSFALGGLVRSRLNEPSDAGVGAINAAIFGLFGLLVAFTFSGAASRYDTHRQLTGEEAGHIGTAYLRLDLLAPEAQPPARELTRRYVDSRIEVYRALPDLEAARRQLASSNRLQAELWRMLVQATELPGGHRDAGKLLLPAAGAMFDIATKRTTVFLIHPPREIMYLLFGLGLLCAFLIGKELRVKGPSGLIHAFGYALITAAIVFYIVDLEYPWRGWIRADAYDRMLVDVRSSMNDGR